VTNEGDQQVFWKIFPNNPEFFNFCLLGLKNFIGSGQKVPRSEPGQPLIYYRSKVCTGRVGSGPISTSGYYTVVMGPGQIFLPGLGRVHFLWLGSGQVGSAIYGLGLNLENFSNFSIFILRIKKNCFGSGRKVPRSKPSWPLIYCRSKVRSGQVRAHFYYTTTFFHIYILIVNSRTYKLTNLWI